MTAPPTIELLYVDGCPHHDALVPRLRQVLAEHGVDAPISLIRVGTLDDAQRLRFLGSPTLRVDGVDVDPTAAARDGYGLQCRLYVTPDGTSGTPPEEWIVAALTGLAESAAVDAVLAGEVSVLQQLLADHPGLARARLRGRGGRTLLHVATDWPGHPPRVAATIAALVAAGADPDAACPETPLHWAASSDDLDAVDALLDARADIDAPGAVIAGGTPLADATAFGQWAAARRLVERGARTDLWQAAALGMVERVRVLLVDDHPTRADVTAAFWGACHGGSRETAEVLLDHGADINRVGWDDLTPLDAALRSDAWALAGWLRERGATSTP